MKYINKFYPSEYKLGDYVYVIGYPKIKNLAKIDKTNIREEMSWDYIILAIDKQTGDVVRCYIDHTDIERLLTTDEIDRYELEIISKKYNL